MKTLMLGAALLVAPGILAAQDTAIVINPETNGVHFAPPELPRQVADSAIGFFNSKTTSRLVGRTEIPAGTVWQGDVAVRNGPVILAGTIDGSLLVINGDLVLKPGAVVTGTVLVVGGELSGSDSSRVEGKARVFYEALGFRMKGDSLQYSPNLRRRYGQLAAEYVFNTPETRSALTIATGGTYDRVEGLPLVFGPVFDWQVDPRDHLHVDAMGVFRTAGDLSGAGSDLGYRLRGEMRTGRYRPVAFAFSAFNVVSPVEDWSLSGSEVGWSAFLFRRDYRDYYADQGLSLKVSVQPERQLTTDVEWRKESERSITSLDPFSMFRNDEVWRPNPPIDGGHYHTLGLGVTLDTRNDPEEPTTGWWARLKVERSTSPDVAPQTGVPAFVRPSIPTDGSYEFSRFFVEARTYQRIGGFGRANLRVLLGGWLGGGPLPLQDRLSIGGPDPMAGYPFRYSGCNKEIVDPAFGTSQPAACDRILLFQGEYRGHINLRWAYNPGEDQQESGLLYRLEGPDLVVFGDAGQAWLVGTGPGRIPSNRIPTIGSWLADLGLGIDWGGVGLYAAKAVTIGQPVRLTLRLRHRF
ncbi:MAG TPA: BamA/TamA family outer membrane protein [Gemmatimonadales bacterium]|nr:BamA/TamA family outer membrane protein [Gemmatimonadales bacterium]